MYGGQSYGSIEYGGLLLVISTRNVFVTAKVKIQVIQIKSIQTKVRIEIISIKTINALVSIKVIRDKTIIAKAWIRVLAITYTINSKAKIKPYFRKIRIKEEIDIKIKIKEIITD